MANGSGRLTEQQLYDFAEQSLPAAGTSISYADWYTSIKQSEHPEAALYYRMLKKRGVVKATLTQNEDGTISHIIQRA